MKNLLDVDNQIYYTSSFQELISVPFYGNKNAACWKRSLIGDFSEIVNKIELTNNIVELEEEELRALVLSEQGQIARETLLSDLKLLKAHGAAPVLNLIKYYEKDHDYSFFPTDVYSFHVDHSPILVDTFLCTYYGEPSEILPNSQAEQKILIPEIRDELQKLYGGNEEGFEAFLNEYFFDLHYQAKPEAQIINLGLGNLWRLATECPQSEVLPCIHCAPEEKNGQIRLLLIC